MLSKINQEKRGFTLLELLVVIAIIGIVAAIVLFSVSSANQKGRDGGRKQQLQEVLKALELYYSDNDAYPTQAVSNRLSDVTLTGYIGDLPNDPFGVDTYMYCSSGQSMVVAVRLETGGGSDYCHVTRGSAPYGCDYVPPGHVFDATDACSVRF